MRLSVASFSRLVVIGALVCCASSVSLGQSAPDRTRTALRVRSTGTFTSLSSDQETGDLLGTEIHIVAARHGLQATVQVAEGSPSDLIVVRQITTGNGGRISFELPSNDLNLGRFDGTITRSSLSGTWTYSDGRKERVALRRGRSYWE